MKLFPRWTGRLLRVGSCGLLAAAVLPAIASASGIGGGVTATTPVASTSVNVSVPTPSVPALERRTWKRHVSHQTRRLADVITNTVDSPVADYVIDDCNPVIEVAMTGTLHIFLSATSNSNGSHVDMYMDTHEISATAAITGQQFVSSDDVLDMSMNAGPNATEFSSFEIRVHFIASGEPAAPAPGVTPLPDDEYWYEMVHVTLVNGVPTASVDNPHFSCY